MSPDAPGRSWLPKDATGNDGRRMVGAPDGWIAVFLLAGFTACYLICRQASLTYNGAAFVTYWADIRQPTHLRHPLFVRAMLLAIETGRLLDLRPLTSGQIFSSFFGGLSVAVFYLLLREYRIGIATSLIYAGLLALNQTMLQSATSIELYTCSLFAVILSFHCLHHELRQPSRRNAVFLWLASLGVLAFHLGYAFWVMGTYLVLVWRDRSDRRQVAKWIGQCAAAGAAIALWALSESGTSGNQVELLPAFFERFWRKESGISFFATLLRAPLFDFAAFAGLILFPATISWNSVRKTYPEEVRLLAVCCMLFLPVYSFWAVDTGGFYFPLQPIFGLVSALTVDRLIVEKASKRLLVLACAAMAYSVLFMLVPQTLIPWRSGTIRWAIIGCFWTMPVASSWVAHWLELETPENNQKYGGVGSWAYGATAITLSLIAYLPVMMELKRPDEVTQYVNAFLRIAPDGERLVTHVMTFVPEAQSGHEILSPMTGYNAPEKTLTRWLRESRIPGGKPIIFDQEMYEARERIWTQGSGVQVPLDELTFLPVSSGRWQFYRVESRLTEPRRGLLE